ncbi:MAG: stage V sporulation protein AB [Tissierella sp.]|uniref:stage V sporulation protein AB n=1 Tax=Tissierella sp. TaxID=41274 RepID=UPI003F9A6BB9
MKEFCLILISISGGLAVGGALAAFITLLNLIARLVQLTESPNYVKIYEWMFSIGTFIFVLLYFSDFSFNLSNIFVVIIGLFMGAFIGLFSSALAEVLNVIPLISKKLKVKKDLKYIIYSLLFGKVMGSLYFWTLY